jgi:N-acetylglucosamine-6-phosphate deacetylase
MHAESNMLVANQYLGSNGVSTGSFSVRDGQWVEFSPSGRATGLQPGAYFVAQRPTEIHCHGIGRFDFTDIPNLDLDEIESNLRAEGVNCVLTLYLLKSSFDALIRLLEDYEFGRRRGTYTHIAGVAIEGPVLASHGGTPSETVWMPSARQWLRLAGAGALGLRYMVVSPDALWSQSEPQSSLDRAPPDIQWICDALLDGGVLPAPGHFTKQDPQRSAIALRSMLERVAARGLTNLSDHLFNDMPRLFKHAWRTPEERIHRLSDLHEMKLDEWSIEELARQVGPVPATLMQAAAEGIVKPCLNFDGEHVDIAISQRTVDLLGADNLIAMTDRIDSRVLAGRHLSTPEKSTLLYEHHGLVAAGTQPFAVQRARMLSVGIADIDIWRMFAFNSSEVLNFDRTRPARLSPPPVYVSSSGAVTSISSARQVEMA